MKTCNKCGKEKNEDKFSKNSKSKDGLQSWCKQCYKKPKSTKEIKYRKCKSLINPENPIPLKKVGQDGFGGKWSFDIERIKNERLILEFIQANGLHNTWKKNPLWQVKSKNKQQMIDLAKCIGMNESGVTHIKREDGKEQLEVYVVNLYHPNILEVVR